jgi:DNA polymerase
MGGFTPQKNFVECSPPNTEIQARLPENTMQDYRRKKLSSTNVSAVERMTYDIGNAGPNQRFVVLSEAGPIIVHNCGYQLGAGKRFVDHKSGEEEATGLLGYAWNMGVKDFTEADSELSVTTFRSTFKEVPEYWKDIENAAKRCIRTGRAVDLGPLTFDRKGPFMRIKLPSGRFLHYYRPKIRKVMAPWGKMIPNVTYEGLNGQGQWVQTNTHGGKLTENVCQAVSRDILGNGMMLADKEGIDIRIHVHDQILGLVREEEAEDKLKILMQCMNEVPVWAKGFPLASDGFVSRLFIKD